jgi:hypothetical protein
MKIVTYKSFTDVGDILQTDPFTSYQCCVSKHQRGNQKHRQYDETQTIQWPNEKQQQDNNDPQNTTQKTNK